MTQEQAKKAIDLLCELWAEQHGCKIVKEDDAA